jgi:hypothetical protein
MPSFPCDNTGDFIPDEMYDIVRYCIEEKRRELGRDLTQDEIDKCYTDEGFEPPTESYRSPVEEED